MSHPVVRVPGNPLDVALRALKMTRAAFGAKYGLSKSYLLRVSQGRQSSLSDFIKQALLEEADIRGLEDFIDLEAGWESWIHRHRASQSLPKPTQEADLNPFARLVSAVGGITRISAIMAVPDVLVTRYLREQTREMPSSIRESLEEMRYPYRVALERSMDQWMDSSR